MGDCPVKVFKLELLGWIKVMLSPRDIDYPDSHNRIRVRGYMATTDGPLCTLTANFVCRDTSHMISRIRNRTRRTNSQHATPKTPVIY